MKRLLPILAMAALLPVLAGCAETFSNASSSGQQLGYDTRTGLQEPGQELAPNGDAVSSYPPYFRPLHR